MHLQTRQMSKQPDEGTRGLEHEQDEADVGRTPPAP